MSERDLLAPEHVLRLLEGEELMEAGRLAASDPAFAAEAAVWEERLAPLFDDISDEAPSVDAWERIVRRLDGTTDRTVVALRRKLARWRAGAVAAAIAAAVLLLLQLAPASRAPVPAPAQPTQPAPLLVASLAGAGAPEALTVAFSPETAELVVTSAPVEASGGRARQLWLIPPRAQPISLGLIEPDGVQRREVRAGIARNSGPVLRSLYPTSQPAARPPVSQLERCWPRARWHRSELVKPVSRCGVARVEQPIVSQSDE
jgi:anti-sigma-K factor RskA